MINRLFGSTAWCIRRLFQMRRELRRDIFFGIAKGLEIIITSFATNALHWEELP
jgi:hypothetical protein